MIYNRLIVAAIGFIRLEPYDGKLSRTVPRGEGSHPPTRLLIGMSIHVKTPKVRTQVIDNGPDGLSYVPTDSDMGLVEGSS